MRFIYRAMTILKTSRVLWRHDMLMSIGKGEVGTIVGETNPLAFKFLDKQRGWPGHLYQGQGRWGKGLDFSPGGGREALQFRL